MEKDIINICYDKIKELLDIISKKYSLDDKELFSLIIYGDFIDEKIIKEGEKYYVLDSNDKKYLELDENKKQFKYMY